MMEQKVNNRTRDYEKNFRIPYETFEKYKHLYKMEREKRNITNKEMFIEMLELWEQKELLNTLLNKEGINLINPTEEGEIVPLSEFLSFDEIIIGSLLKKKNNIYACFNRQIEKGKDKLVIIFVNKESYIDTNAYIKILESDKRFRNKIKENFRKAKKRYIKSKNIGRRKYTEDNFLQDLAKRFDVHEDTISKALQGTHPLYAENILVLEEEFNIHRDEILGDYITKDNVNEYKSLKELILVYKQNPELQKQISTVLNLLVKMINDVPETYREKLLDELYQKLNGM